MEAQMMRRSTFRSLLAAAAAALAVELVPAAVCAQIGDPVQARGRPLIIVDGVVLQGGTATEQESLLKMIQPAIESIEVVKGVAAVQRYGAAAADGVILIRLKSEFARTQAGAAERATRDVLVTPGVQSLAPLVIVDGVIVPRSIMDTLSPQDIERIEVIKGPAAAEQFGERGRAGVIQITTRKRQTH
jgi:outer membrane receptor for ferrienterochelin and colicin